MKLSTGQRWWIARMVVTVCLAVLNVAAYPASVAVELWHSALIGAGVVIFMDIMRWSWRQAAKDNRR